MASRLVYTAITNGHAQLCARPEIPDTDFVCFSDVALDRSDWEIRPIVAPSGLSPRMQAKFHKLFPPQEYEWTIWVDGSHALKGTRMADEMIAASPSGLGMHKHPRLDCIYAEGEDILTHDLLRTKRLGQPVADQLQRYRRQGHPAHWGLWAGGSICRNQDPCVRDVMMLWWIELLTWSDRDQISLPVVLRSVGRKPDTWSWSLYSNPHFTIEHNWES